MVEICDMRGIDQAYWLADKIPAYGDYAKEAANVLRRQAHELERLLAAQEELLGEVARLRTQRDDILAAARRTLDENGHLADGEICTLIVLKRAVETLDEAKIRLEKEQDALRRLALSLDYCPNCGGEADNGHSRGVPPVPYFCKACSVPKTVWDCHKCFPKLCRCEDRNEAPNAELTGDALARRPG